MFGYNDVKIRSDLKAESRVCINNTRDQKRTADCRIDKHRLWVDVSDKFASFTLFLYETCIELLKNYYISQINLIKEANLYTLNAYNLIIKIQ